jgi:hypothetical protein
MVPFLIFNSALATVLGAAIVSLSGWAIKTTPLDARHTI